MGEPLPCFVFPLEARPHISDGSCKENIRPRLMRMQALIEKFGPEQREVLRDTFMGHTSSALPLCPVSCQVTAGNALLQAALAATSLS